MIRKNIISEASYKMLFDYLTSVFEMPYMDFQPHLRQKLAGYDCKAPEHLIRELDGVKKCWFIVKGMVMVYYSDFKKGTVVYQLFEAGEIAILHDEFVNGARLTRMLGRELINIAHMWVSGKWPGVLRLYHGVSGRPDIPTRRLPGARHSFPRDDLEEQRSREWSWAFTYFIISIEGNTNLDGSRNGNGVYRRMRHKRSIANFSEWL